MTDEQRAENVLNDLENIDQDGATPALLMTCRAHLRNRRPPHNQRGDCRFLREKS